MDAAGVAGPGYRIRPGARQSLRLDAPEDLVGYAQTLGFQVNLFAIADTLARRHGLPERAFWDRLRSAVEGALRVDGLRAEVAELLERVVLQAPTWPSRTLVGPLLARGRSDSVSMPAGLGTVPNPLRADPRARARAATVIRLVNCALREIGPAPDGPGPLRLHDPGSGRNLVVTVRHHSPSGHHTLDEEAHVEEAGAVRVAGHDEVVEILLGIVAAAAEASDTPASDTPARTTTLTRQIADSTARSARYLAADPRPTPTDLAGQTRHAEQSVRLGHPFHPTPKSLEPDASLGPGAAGLLERCAPELGASFRLPHLALDPALAAEALDGPGPWLADGAVAAAPSGWPVVPVHPVQLAHLRARPETARLLAEGALVELGEHGGEVYPTSSVRTVCDPDFPTAWKLPLHVRITNFIRTVPPEHAARARDASRVVRALRPGWTYPGFGVVVETGWRGADPGVVGEDVAADLTVVFRENPTPSGGAPRVLAGLVEEGPRGGEPELVAAVRASGLDARRWLREYLHVSLLPMIDIFARDGVGFEAHLQNSLLITGGGRPVGFRVRDMEGTHVDRDRLPASLDPASPLVYGSAEAWQRFRYHVVVNQLAGVIGTLGRHLGGERALWAVVAEALSAISGPAAAWADDLRTSSTLPAKANLLSRFSGRGETPLYVGLPNPIRTGDAAKRSSTSVWTGETC